MVIHPTELKLRGVLTILFKAAITIHKYCESTAEARENDCRSCFLYNRLKDGCGVNWSEKALDENILALCKDGTII